MKPMLLLFCQLIGDFKVNTGGYFSHGSSGRVNNSWHSARDQAHQGFLMIRGAFQREAEVHNLQLLHPCVSQYYNYKGT